MRPAILVSAWSVAFVTLILALVLPASAAADAPTAFPFTESFVDVNPCTGEDHTVTVTGTFYVYERGADGLSHRLDRTVTTSSGFSGHGMEISIFHDRIFRIRDVLSNDEGQHLLAQFIFVSDADRTPHVLRFTLTCVP